MSEETPIPPDAGSTKTPPDGAAAATPPTDAASAATPLVEPAPRRSLWKLLKNLVVRVYALGVLLLVCWAGYAAVYYLLTTVFVPQPVPERFVKWEGKTDPATLRDPAPKQTSLRAPLSHYHQSGRFVQADPANSCTVAGCHEMLPHNDPKKVPAFANFHTTFLTCQMCHEPGGNTGITWVSTRDGARAEIPPGLRLAKVLAKEADPNDGKALTAEILPLLDAVMAGASDGGLNEIRLGLTTTEPGSPIWKMALAHLQQELPRHLRGEYGAKLAREASAGDYRAKQQQLAEDVPAYLREAKDSPARKQLHEKTHAGLIKAPAACVTCHGGKDTTLDYAALGYGEIRTAKLKHLQLASLMQQIREGQKFYIPKLMGGGDGK